MASGDTLLILPAQSATLPAANLALFDTITGGEDTTGAETFTVLDFSQIVSRYADFLCVMPSNYSAATGVTVIVHYACAVNTGNVMWSAGFYNIADDSDDIDAPTTHFSMQNFADDTVPNVIGEVGYASLNIAHGVNMDTVIANNLFMLRIGRIVGGGSDAAGEAQLLSVHIKEQ
jgi:hypothetical protein